MFLFDEKYVLIWIQDLFEGSSLISIKKNYCTFFTPLPAAPKSKDIPDDSIVSTVYCCAK